MARPEQADLKTTEMRKELKARGVTYFTGEYEKPMVCAYCGVFMDGEATLASSFQLADKQSALVVSFKCARCKKHFLAVYIQEDECLKLNTIIPIVENEALHEGLKAISPDFECIHQQAYRAEMRGDLDIAAIGYRTALEMLTKDFAIKELKEKENEVTNKSLAQMIKDYSGSVELQGASDVVRILGNDFTHYQKKHEEHGFDELKHYYNIVLQAFSIRYDMRHPPVG